MRISGTFSLYRYPQYIDTKNLENFILPDLVDIIMYAKIRAKNWATLFEIDPSKEPKIKSVAQFYLTLIRMPDWKTTVIFSSECTSMESSVRSITP